MGQRWVEGNTAVGEKGEVISAITLTIIGTYIHGLSMV
jgi:hypothetical protein